MRFEKYDNGGQTKGAHFFNVTSLTSFHIFNRLYHINVSIIHVIKTGWLSFGHGPLTLLLHFLNIHALWPWEVPD